MVRRIGVVVLSIVLGTETAYVADKKHQHPGNIVDAYAHNGIKARASAYGSSMRKGGEDCPLYDDPLQNTSSESPSGAFTFQIDSGRASYVAAYCQQGYASRTVTANNNSADGTRVQPDPVTLYPNKASIAAQHLDATEVAFVAIATELDRTRENLRYYSVSDPDAYKLALEKRFSTDDRRLIEALAGRSEPLLKPRATFNQR